MSTTDGIDVVAGGPPDDDAGGRPPGRWRPVGLVGAGIAVGVLVGWAAAGGNRTSSEPAPRSSPSSTSLAPSGGVVLPELVDAVTLPLTGQQSVVTVPEPGSGEPRYDYSIVNATWLAPDGTVRAGPPGCTLPLTAVQHLQVAVVHVRAFAGGPDWDIVAWYRCAPAGG